MIVVLEAVSGPITGRRIEVRAGSILRIGRTTRADYAIGEDSYLSSLHFAVECDGVQARVRDMGSSNGTFVNGSRITEQLVQQGDSLAAGESTFTIHLEASTPAGAPAEAGRGNTATTPMFSGPAGAQGPGVRTATVALPGPSGAAAWPGFSRGQSVLLRALFPLPPGASPSLPGTLPALPGSSPALPSASPAGAGTVYAVLDAMRDSRIQAFLDASGERYQALDPSARVQVYVVAPAPQGRLLDVLIKDGWGHGWGFFCVSSFAMEEICAHLRNYMLLYTGAGRPLTFRFWDPRVLRVFAPALPPE